MNYNKLKHSQFIVNLYIKVCKKKPKFRYFCRRAYQFLTYKICKQYKIDHDVSKLKLNSLNLEAFIYHNIRNNTILKYYLLRNLDLPFKKFIFKALMSVYFIKLYIRGLYRSTLFIYAILGLKHEISKSRTKLCYFFDIPKPLNNKGNLTLKKTIFLSVLKDANSEIALFDTEKKNRWIDLFCINLKSKKSFFFESFLYILSSFLNLFRNTKRYKSFMLDEIIKSVSIKYFNNIKYETHFLNFVSNGCYKPIWLNLSETKFKTKSSFIWNSISMFPQYYSINDLFLYNIPKMTWDNEYVISENHKNLLISLRKNPNTSYNILKYTDLFTNNIDIKIPNKSYILIFPLTPQSLDFHLQDSSLNDIYGNLTKVMIKFISDITEICMKMNLNIIIKDKRQSYTNDQIYLEYLNNLKSNPKVLIINKNTSIENLIENSIASISFPITSTCEISNKMNIPSAFYSVNKNLNSNQIEFMKNSVLKSKQQLYKWIKKLV